VERGSLRGDGAIDNNNIFNNSSVNRAWAVAAKRLQRVKNLQRVSLSDGRCKVSGKQHGKETGKVIKEWNVAVSAETEP
jgi:hypothetical protein